MKNVLVLGVAALALVGCAKKEEAPATTADPCATVTQAQPDNNTPQPTGEVSKDCVKAEAPAPATPADPCANVSSGNPAAEPSAECVASKEAAAKKDL
jgi:hypothetical protein